MKRISYIVFTCLYFSFTGYAAENRPASSNKVDHVYEFTVSNYIPYLGDHWAMNRILWKFMRKNPDIVFASKPSLNAGRIPGGGKILKFAGGTADDVLMSHFWSIRNDIHHGFLCPLNEYIGYDGFYGLNEKTLKPDKKTGTRKLRKNSTGEYVPDINGKIDNDEALWPGWHEVPDILRIVSSVPGDLDKGPDGKPYRGAVVYGVPKSEVAYYGLAYRKDLFERAGLTEKDIPKTWDEFWYVCQRLTKPNQVIANAKFQKGQRALALPEAVWQWLVWLYAAGGDCIVQDKTNPATGKTYTYPMEESKFIDPETGVSLSMQPSKWRATFADKGGQEVMDFYHKLCWAPWIVNPATGLPIDLTAEDVAAGVVVDKTTGKKVVFDPKLDVIYGVVRSSNDGADGAGEMFRRGEVVFMQTDLMGLERLKIPAANLGFCAIPGGPNGKPMVGYYRHFMSLNATLKKDKGRRDAAFRVLAAICGKEALNDTITTKILKGYASFLTPQQIKMAGKEEYLDQLSDDWKKTCNTVVKNARTEPFIGSFAPVTLRLERNVISFIVSNKDYDYQKSLKQVENEANNTLMFGLSEDVKAKYRPIAWVLVGLGVFLLVLGGFFIVRAHSKNHTDVNSSTGAVYKWWMPVLMLAPAVVTILMWQYYPLFRGSVMAFQDVNIIGHSKWVGVDNFISVFCTRNFYVYLGKTFKYCTLSLGLSFLTPIFVAILLTEIPRFKTMFRTVYFLPQISSGLVVMFIWKMFYNPTEFGMLNRLLLQFNNLPVFAAVLIKFIIFAVVVFILAMILKAAIQLRAADKRLSVFIRWGLVGLVVAFCGWMIFSGNIIDVFKWLTMRFEYTPQNWLGDPKWAMIAVILPGVWASAGMGSLIYIAALKSIDDDAYEAAEIDGCSFMDKLIFITFPYLKPLIIINFIGAFIATFHTMANIFAMTGGGPGDETMVLSLAIWYEAFGFMRFGTATAMAWSLGLMLIGFTVYQLRILNKVDFRRAKD